MIRAVIFDMGGTLLRFVRPGTGSWREMEERGIRGLYHYFVDQGHPVTEHEDDFVEVMFARLAEGWEQSTGGHVNLRAIDWIAAGAEHHKLSLNEQVLVDAAQAYARPIREGVTVVPGAVEALTELRKRDIRVGLISNTIWPGTLLLEDLLELGLLQSIEHTIFSGDAGVWKPMPAIFERMLEALQVSPHEAVFVGDNPKEDILGAQNVGMHTIWIRSLEFPLGDVQPDAIIHDQSQLLDALAGMDP